MAWKTPTGDMIDVDHAYAVIMAGGKGERFWPLSTSRRPKQLLSLAGGRPLILQAVDRLAGVVPPERILIVTSESLVAPIRDMLGEGSAVGILGEPVGRDTAAAIAAGAAWIRARDPAAVFCVLTADHIIGDLDLFRQTLREGLRLCASEDVLMTIGIPPTEPSSAYGYIEAGEVYRTTQSIEFLRVRRFVEKPDRATAETYLASGRHAWNSGMFIWSIASLERAFSRHAPELAECMARWSTHANPADFQQALEQDFPGLAKISIDYAVMEKAQNVVMCQGRFAWDDVGSWPALESHLPRDDQRNAVQGDAAIHAGKRNIVVSEGRLTALVGVSDLVVVQADGVTLVCAKDRSQDIKRLLAELRKDPERKNLL